MRIKEQEDWNKKKPKERDEDGDEVNIVKKKPQRFLTFSMLK